MTLVDQVPLLIVTGTIGAGKSAVGGEMHRILVDERAPHAFLDCDDLFTSYQAGGAYSEELKLKNLAVVWQNFQEHGAERLLLAEVIESAAHLEPYACAVPGAQATVCRLLASLPVREARIRARERGAALEWHLERTVELERIMESNSVGDFVVRNDDRNLTDVAREVLETAGWLGRRVARP